MDRPFDPADLPDDIARIAEAQVATGRFASVEDVLRAGVEVIANADEMELAWLSDVRAKWRAGLSDSARGTGVEGTAAQHMARIRARVEPA